MASDDLHRSHSSSNGRPVDIELDVKLLGSFLAESEDIHEDDSKLLTRLDSAHIVAGGVEARLDGILSTLDGLLASLEPKESDKTQEAMMPCSESQSKRPPPKQP